MTSVMPKQEVEPMSPERLKTVMKKLVKARTALVLEHPFVGSIALNMPYEMDHTIPTAATNGKRIKFNPYFIEDLTDEEVKFLVAHECFHPMLEHPFRRGDRNHRKWNQAGDYVINQLLTDEGIGKMIDGGLINKSLFDAGKGTTDGIYNILPDEEGDDPLDDCEDGDGTPAEREQQSAEWKVKVAQAAQSAKMMGKMSAGLERLVDQVLKPKVDWHDVTRRFLIKCKSDSRSFARFNRRFLPQGLYLPSASGETLGEIVYAVDCSGSVGMDDINQFASEIKYVKDDLNPTCIHVVYFDSSVCHYDKFERDDEVVVSPHGGGGTAFSPVFKYLEEHGIEPTACIFLTDLYCDDFGDEPQYPVMWVSYGAKEAPFGEVVMM